MAVQGGTQAPSAIIEQARKAQLTKGRARFRVQLPKQRPQSGRRTSRRQQTAPQTSRRSSLMANQAQARLASQQTQQLLDRVGQAAPQSQPRIQRQQQAPVILDQATENATGQQELSQKIANLQELAATEQNVQARNQINAAIDQTSAQLREKTKRYAKQAFRRLVIYIVDMIAMALDLSSATITLIIDWSLYLFTFSWLNLEMIYGRHMAKGKSKFIGPISWAPLKVPVDPNAIILQSLIISADIALAIAAGAVMFVGAAVVYVVVEVAKDPLAVVTAGSASLNAPSGFDGIIQILLGISGN